MDLRDRSFELIENASGHAQRSTTIEFTGETDPFVATYSGPNIVKGQAAGKAKVSLDESADKNAVITLDWEWLTGDRSSGVSRWVEIVD